MARLTIHRIAAILSPGSALQHWNEEHVTKLQLPEATKCRVLEELVYLERVAVYQSAAQALGDGDGVQRTVLAAVDRIWSDERTAEGKSVTTQVRKRLPAYQGALRHLATSGYAPIGQVFADFCHAESTPLVRLGTHVYVGIAEEVSAFLSSLLGSPTALDFSPN